MRRAVCLVPIALVLAGCAAAPDPQEGASSALQGRQGWASFASACGFALQHPLDWQVAGTDALGFFALRAPGGEGSISIVAFPPGTADDIAVDFELSEEQGKRVVEAVPTTLLGAEATRYVVEDVASAERFVAYAVELEGGGLLVSAREKLTNEEQEVFETLAANGPVGSACRVAPSPAALPADVDAPWSAFQSALGWSVEHPAGWEQVPLARSGEALVLRTPMPAHDHFQETLTIVTRPNGAGYSLEAFVDEYVAALEAKYEGFELQSIAHAEPLDGHDAMRIRSFERHIGGDRWFTRVVSVQAEWVVLLECEFGDPYGEHLEELDKVASSFRFSEDAGA